MHPDDVGRAVDALVSSVPPPPGAASQIIARGRRGAAQRRTVVVGAAVISLAAVAAFGTALRDHDHTATATPAHPVATTVPRPNATGSTSTPPATVIAYPEFVAITAVSALEAWKCLDPLQHTIDGGRTWHTVARPADPSLVDDRNVVCTAVPGGTAWSVLTTNDPPPAGVLRVERGAETAVFPFPHVPSDAALTELIFVDAKTGWAMTNRGTSPRQDLYRTLDGGETWALVAEQQTIGYSHVFTSPTRGWAEYGDQVLTTLDGGARWQPVALPEAPAFAVGQSELEGVRAHGSSVVVWRRAQRGTVVRPFFDLSPDGGETWWQRRGPTQLDVSLDIDSRFDAPDAEHWRLLFGRQLWITDDGGHSWTRSPGPELASVESMAFPTPAVGWLMGKTSGGTAPVVLRTGDGGRTWTDVTYGRPFRLNPLPRVSGGIIGCPEQPLTPAPEPGRPGEPPPGVVDAAVAEVKAHAHWDATSVSAVYPVGYVGAGAFGNAFIDNVSSCRRSRADRYWVVELQRENGAQVRAVVLAHSATGWQPFGHYP